MLLEEVYWAEGCEGAVDIVEHVDHPGADAEEGGEREDREELGDEQQLGREGLPLQQVGRAGHQVVLGADLGSSVTSVNAQAQ